MLNQKIQYSFNQFESSIIGLCSYLQLKLQEIVPNLPVFVLNTGDFSYYVDKKFVETDNKDIYLKTPRVILKIDDIQQNQSEDTNQYNKFIYKFDDKIYQAVVRRKAYNVQISCNFVSPNFIIALNHMEVMATLTAHDNVFTYEFMGNTCQSAFTIQQSGNEVPSIDMGQGGTRNVSTTFMIELQTHLLVPRIESIILLDDTEIDTIHDDIVVNGEKEQKDDVNTILPEVLKNNGENSEISPYIDVIGNKKVPRNIRFK